MSRYESSEVLIHLSLKVLTVLPFPASVTSLGQVSDSLGSVEVSVYHWALQLETHSSVATKRQGGFSLELQLWEGRSSNAVSHSESFGSSHIPASTLRHENLCSFTTWRGILEHKLHARQQIESV